MNYSIVNVFVPMYNNCDVLDETIESIRALDYDPEKIFLFLTDFGSTDGTLEKAFTYRGEQTAILSLAGRRIGRTMIADMITATQFQDVGGRRMVLWPGDVLYPHCFKVAENYLYRTNRAGVRCSWLAAEVDVRDARGVVRRQMPLFTKSCYFRARSTDSSEYVRKGWRHAVLTYAGTYSAERGKISTQVNQSYWWQNLTYHGMVQENLSYLNESLGCFRERYYGNELDEILFRFEMGLTIFRMSGEVPEVHVTDKGFEANYRSQLSMYAVWRAFLLLEMVKRKEAEDCLLIARVINPDIASDECWLRMERFLERNEASDQTWLQEWFAREEPSDIPKWPIGGSLTNAWQRLRQRFGRAALSKWGNQ